MNWASLGWYQKFISNAIFDLSIEPTDSILDLGCGTGRNASFMLSYLGHTGKITGIDLSSDMKKQFEKRFTGDHRVNFVQQRIDVPFDLGEKFDIVFISFVIHGFPHEVRTTIIENAKRHLKPCGYFAILDFGAFRPEEMPALHRFIFKKIECPYAFDFVKRDWKAILNELGLCPVTEYFFVKKYVRLLKTQLSE
jgi:demethylmenaquinone methyltransferase/2-methoxy-6-polyprenyl-1,4-benzoquinol methylase